MRITTRLIVGLLVMQLRGGRPADKKKHDPIQSRSVEHDQPLHAGGKWADHATI